MSRLVAKLLLSAMIMPLSAITYLCIGMLLIATNILDVQPGMMAANLITWAAVSTYWILLWRSSVDWTRVRLVATVASFVVAAIAGVVAGAALSVFYRELHPIAILTAGLVTMVGWLVSSVFIWRETRHERMCRLRTRGAGTVLCPVCRYNMTGLRETTCPECGGTFTLTELVATQIGQDIS